MATVELRSISKEYDAGVKAVDRANITVDDREFVIFVGPSGCGKTTTLRMIAGLEDITDGDLFIDSVRVNDIPPKDRDIAFVFQNYALYPHMTVYNNMAFGLRIRKYPKEEIDTRVKEASQILEIEELLERRPKALSGGQRQRVAVGRAIVRKPKVFLFDEPLSNLDAKLRVQMRAEISSLHTRLEATMIYVTHDQVEAMTMADKIVVMKDGLIQQIGDPLTLYHKPVNKFVAGFMGSPSMNFLNVTVKEQGGKIVLDEGAFTLEVPSPISESLKTHVGKTIVFGIRPEDMGQASKEEKGLTISAKIEIVEPLGPEIHLHVNTDSHHLIAKVPSNHMFHTGETIYFTPDMKKASFFDMETEAAIVTPK
jgi:multiple sugar transport system ATP-binding protein